MKSESGPQGHDEEKQPVSLPEKKDLSPVLDRVASLIRTISKKNDLVVTTQISDAERASLRASGQNPDEAWFYTEKLDPITREFKGGHVHVPERILEVNENIAKGKAAHEAGHVVITRMGRFIPDDVAQEPGFHQFIAAIEERPTDQVVRDRFEGAGKWVDEARRDIADQEKILAGTKKNIGYIPKSLQLGGLIVYAPHYGDTPPPALSPDVALLYEKIKGDVEKVEHMLPRDGASEQEILEQAKARYKHSYTRIWPKVKKLVAEDMKTEELRQMLNKSRRQKSEGEGDPGEGEVQEVEQLLKDLLDAMEDGLRQELEKAMSKTPPPAPEEELTPVQEGGESSTDEGEGDPPIAMNELSEELMNKLRKAFDRLPHEVKQELRERARKVFEKIEDEMVKEFSGMLESTPLETHEEFQKRVEEKTKERRRSEEEMLVTKELEHIERKQASMEASRSVYDRTYAEIQKLDDELYRELEEIFTPNIKEGVRLKSTGAKINLPAVFRWEASRESKTGKVDDRIFESVINPEKKDYAFTILNDLSGSMRSGGKIEEDFKATILFAEVLNRLGVNYELLGFQDEVIELKTFDETLDDTIRKRISGMPLEVINANPRGHNYSMHNADGYCLGEASKGLAKQPNKEKFLIVISDGQPTMARRARWRSPEDELHEVVGEILKNTDQKLIGLGLGEDTEHVKSYYPTALPNIRAENLPTTLGALLKDMIEHPEKYASRPR